MNQSTILALMPVGIALILAACLSPHVTAMFLHPRVDGPYSTTLTKEDVQQIIELSYTRQDIRKPVYRIYAEAPHQADVSGGHPHNTGDLVTGFKVYKKNGRWMIIKGSVFQTEAIITS